ncbi:MAG TPA: prepilin-type N-terminal cleavage/methylation domain-containing protein [Armatimonadota bacterium]|jgi:prepilin-type N-terminal cleavage/methylation domain-containing protein/prepilin-type processing-associated H-X9-DG protein
MRRQSVRGFTLIELLVVVAIIAVLAALLLPVFARAKEAGRAATCQSNLRQMGQALRLYVDAWDDYLPCWTTQVYSNFRPIPTLTPYLSNPSQGVWWCPSDPLPDYLPDVGRGISEAFGVSRPFILAYDTSYHLALTFEQGPQGCAAARTYTSIAHPTDTIMVTESWLRRPIGIYGSWLARRELEGWPRLLMFGVVHQGRANYLFADGHVRTLSLRQTLVPKVL